MSISPPTAEPRAPSPVGDGEEPPRTGPHDDATRTTSPESGGPRTARGVGFVSGAALLAGAAAGWMAAGVFDATIARAVAVLGAILGAGLVALSHRIGRPGAVQYATGPIAALAGALVILPDLGGGSASLPSLVNNALFSGGLGQPPVPFDPGWRFLVVVLITLVTSGAASLALSLDRPNLAVVIPVPIVIGASLLQPPEAEVVSTVVAAVLVVAALAVAYGVELAATGATSGRFELQRLFRGVAALAALALGLVVLANTASFLLPDPSTAQVIPPQRPPASPPQADRELFTIEVDRKVPWRLGVLDVYEDGAWKTPPFDLSRYATVDGDVPGAPGLDGDELTATVTIADLPGRVVPTLAVPQAITSPSGEVMIDPRTDALRLGDLARAGFTYTITAAAPATAEELADSPPPPPEMAEFLELPPPPPGVAALLADAPDTNLFERLQYVREAYYAEVLAAGAGDPVDVPPARVDEILDGEPASPYEITAAEAMLARWAGVPSRIGYGFFGGDDLPDGDGFSVRPIHGSSWMEVYFEGEGWVPIVGKPQRARSSFTDSEKNEDSSVRPTDELALITYLPVRLESLTLLFEVVRFYLVQVVPALLLVVALLVFYPVGNKRFRRWRRSRWAGRAGPTERIAVAYAQLRDTAWDLNIGQPSDTPLEFVDRLDHDAEHEELAWLVTRAVWGDLSRDLGDADVREAVDMSRSLERRVIGAQTVVSRLLGAASRASLRDPWSDELPNAWWELRLATRLRRHVAASTAGIRRLVRWVGRRLDPRRLRRSRVAASPTLLVLVLLGAGCAQPLDLTAAADPAVLPSPAVPDAIGDITFEREPTAEVPFEEGGPDALVTAGQVYSVRRDGAIEASLQLAAFRPGLRQREEDVREGILRSLGGGRFEPNRVGGERIQSVTSVEQRLLLWFSPDGRYYQLMVARRSFTDADRLFAAVLAAQRGEVVDDLDAIIDVVETDPRRGFPQ